MKKIIVLMGILFFLCEIGVQAQEVTRGQLMDLHYKARKAEQANNTQEALEIYKTILSIDVDSPTPYLKMADIYSADESNSESASIAIELYNRYLSLQPNDENAPAIKSKVARLEKFTENKPDMNLTDILYINQDQAKNVIETKARRGLKATTKEELERQVEEVTSLYDRTQEAINNNNIEASTQYAEQLLKQADPTNPLTAQTTMMLAGMYGKQGNMLKMKDELAALEENMTMYKQLKQYYSTTLKDALPFEDDICGIWVSDLAYDDATPFLAVEIKKSNSPQKYEQQYCLIVS